LYITAKDDISVHSNLSDPDDPDDIGFDSGAEYKERAQTSDSDFDFGKDAPWNKSDSHVDSSDSGSVEDFAPKRASNKKKDLSTIGETKSVEETASEAVSPSGNAKEEHASDEENAPQSKNKGNKSSTAEESTLSTEPTGENTRVLRAL
jgi:hypothetical protein